MNNDPKSFWVQMAYASSVGFAMVLALFGSLLLGSWLDRKFGTGYKLTVIFVLIGIIVGFRNVYVFIKRSFPESDAPERNIKNEPHRKRPPAKKA